MAWSAAGVQTGTDANLSGLSATSGITTLALGDATFYRPNVMLDIRGTQTIALRECLVFDNGQDTAVGGTVGAARDHDIQVSSGGTLTVNFSSVVNGQTIYSPDPVIISRRPPPSGGGGAHQLNTSGASLAVLNGGIANLTGGLYNFRHNPAVASGGRLNAVGAHFKGAGSRFWMEAGSITSFRDGTIENYNIFFNAFPTLLSGMTFIQCGTITKETTFNGGFDAAPNVVLAPVWLATTQPIINIWGGSWLRVKNASGGSSLGVLNTAIHPWASGIADFVQDVSFTTKDLNGAAVVGFKFWATESDDGKRRNVRQYTGIGPFFNNTDIRTLLFTTAAGGVSNSIEVRLQAGVTTETPTAAAGSGGLVTTNYGQTANDEYDFFGIGYAYQLSQNRIQCRANGALSIATVALPDLSITQAAMATVAAYTTLDTAQQLYDFAKFRLYSDFAGETATYVSRSGNVINAGAYDVIITATAASVFVRSASSLTFKSSVFTGSLTTTGLITLANGALLQNSVVTGNVAQAVPTDLSGVQINGNLTFNTNAPITITLTDCAITGTVSNSGTGAVTISMVNSSIGTVGARVTTRPVTALTLTGLLTNSQIYIADGSGAEVAYVASSGTSYTLDTTGQTGVWTWKVARYNRTAQIGTHSPAVASTAVAVTLSPDLFITQTTKPTVAAYDVLQNLDRLYDYAAFYETTQAGIRYPRIITKAGTSASAGSYPVVINDIGDLFIFDGSALSIWTDYRLEPGATITGALFTTGVVTIPTNFNDAAIIANVSQPEPGDLNNVDITGNLTYGTYAPFGIYVTLTDTVVSGAVSNAGTSDIVITKVNTTLGTVGTRVTARQFATVSAPNLLAGTRVRLLNTTNNIEMFNGVLESAGFNESFVYVGDKNITLTATYVSGATAKLGLSATGIFTANGATFLNTQADDAVYNAYNIDGPTVTGFVADYVEADVNLIMANCYLASRLYAWWIYNTTTEQGIRQFFGGISGMDESNIRINVAVVNLYLDNDTPDFILQKDTIRIYRSDGLYPARKVTSGGGGIHVNWSANVFTGTNESLGATVQDALNDDLALIKLIPALI